MPVITLILASGPGFPSGSPDHRYELEATLDAGGQLDSVRWLGDPAPWPARRFWPDGPVRQGDIQWDEDNGWSLRFGGEGPAADAPLHAMMRAGGMLRPGEYVTIREPDGQEYGYRIVSVT